MRVVAMAAVLVVLAGFTGTAHAAPNRDGDGYEGNYGERWVGTSGTSAIGGVATGGVETDGVNAFRGTNNGWLYAAGGWSAQARQFDVGGWAGRTNCEARFMAKPRDFDQQVTLQVWNPEGWTQVSNGGGILPADQYTQLKSWPFDMSGAHWVYVQAVIGAGSPNQGRAVRLDEFELECF
ncbi:hypothetical protein [Lentzea sp. NPDC059081]|uniref:hypothetical protein n=1 Tax=Lentzea sp. NPDC059081 TaxID=3346719 RepID=UPI003692FBB2